MFTCKSSFFFAEYFLTISSSPCVKWCHWKKKCFTFGYSGLGCENKIPVKFWSEWACGKILGDRRENNLKCNLNRLTWTNMHNFTVKHMNRVLTFDKEIDLLFARAFLDKVLVLIQQILCRRSTVCLRAPSRSFWHHFSAFQQYSIRYIWV